MKDGYLNPTCATQPPKPFAAPTTPLSGPLPSGMRMLIRDAEVFVERVHVLHSINLEIKPGEHWFVTGPNGSGKSTLLRTLYGEEFVALGGEFRFWREHEEIKTLAELRKHVRLVSDRLQAEYTYDDSVTDIVLSGFDGSVGVYRQPTPEERAEVAFCLAQLGLSKLADRAFRSLSTGQARRALLARAMIGSPAMLLLDEPFSGLDKESKQYMMNTLLHMAQSGLQTVMVSHHAEDRLPVTSHDARMDHGKLLYEAVDRL
jgi:molybdate transport system ATP-binding protein